MKEVQSTRRGEDGDHSGDEQDDVQEQQEVDIKPSRNSVAIVKSTRLSQRNAQLQTSTNGTKNTEEERGWVQCNSCDKWRSLPPEVDTSKLPDIWVCSLNVYDPTKSFCDAVEESYKLPVEEEHVQLKSFLKVWTKKLKNADRAENCLSSSAVTRGRKRKLDSEWIQCSSPSCGKWRAVSRGIESASLLRRLNKNRHFASEGEWFCSMNSWDDTTASCAAPQEPLWNCRWNIHNNVTDDNE